MHAYIQYPCSAAADVSQGCAGVVPSNATWRHGDMATWLNNDWADNDGFLPAMAVVHTRKTTDKSGPFDVLRPCNTIMSPMFPKEYQTPSTRHHALQ